MSDSSRSSGSSRKSSSSSSSGYNSGEEKPHTPPPIASTESDINIQIESGESLVDIDTRHRSDSTYSWEHSENEQSYGSNKKSPVKPLKLERISSQKMKKQKDPNYVDLITLQSSPSSDDDDLTLPSASSVSSLSSVSEFGDAPAVDWTFRPDLLDKKQASAMQVQYTAFQESGRLPYYCLPGPTVVVMPGTKVKKPVSPNGRPTNATTKSTNNGMTKAAPPPKNSSPSKQKTTKPASTEKLQFLTGLYGRPKVENSPTQTKRKSPPQSLNHSTKTT